MIPPRKAETAADPELLAGVLGAAAVIAAWSSLVAELAADPADANAALADPEFVDALVGLAALGARIETCLPAADRPEAPTPATALPSLVVLELLR